MVGKWRDRIFMSYKRVHECMRFFKGDGKRLGRHRKNEQRCSCTACFNPRKLVAVHVSPGLSVTTSLDPEPQVCLDDY